MAWKLKDVFTSLDFALGSYRYSVSSVIPGMTRVAWQLKKETFIKEIPGITRRRNFCYNLSRSSYEKEFGTEYQRPGIRTRILAWLFRVVPKFGPFKSLAVPRADPGSRKNVYGQLQCDR